MFIYMAACWLVDRRAIAKKRCILKSLKDIGVQCSAEEVGTALMSSPLLHKADTALARDVMQCAGNIFLSTLVIVAGNIM